MCPILAFKGRVYLNTERCFNYRAEERTEIQPGLDAGGSLFSMFLSPQTYSLPGEQQDICGGNGES